MTPSSRTGRGATTPRLDLDEVLARADVLVCCGAGGVGKTTTAAALALRAAEQGREVCVLTIDPARRLAQSLGLTELDNTPRPVPGAGTDGGSLHAMMLDMKRTFDDVVEAHADPERAAQILANPFYQSLSSSFAGTQEYMAMEKLGQLRAQGHWDLLVVDTPPTRSALDFLDAPERLGVFLDGRLIRVLSAPARAGGKAYLKVVSKGLSLATGVLGRIIGGQLLGDVQTFVAAFEAMFGGFRERADATYSLLKSDGTQFIVIAAPERDALREAAFFTERLAAEKMPLAGVVVNRVHRSAADALTARRALDTADEIDPLGSATGGTGLLAAALRTHAGLVTLAEREQRLQARFVGAHPGVAVAEVAAQASDVHDLAGLRRVGAQLAGQTA